jgi:general secretion pathway protein A
LLQYFLDKMESEMETAVIFNTNVSPQELLNMILGEFGLDHVSGSKALAFDALYSFLIEKYSKDRRVLLIIDEAQNLSREALEEVRMLSNLASNDQMLLQIILAGQPEIRSRLLKPELAQLNQRITVAYHLTGLAHEETQKYIAFRLEKAGGQRDIFTEKAIDRIYQASAGIPRIINIICDSALVYGFADELHTIDLEVIEKVLQDRGGMGLAGEPGQIVQSVSSETSEEYGDMLGRISSLEKGLAELRMQVEWMIGNLEKTIGGYKDDVVRKMNELYTLEKKHTEELISENTRLKERYCALFTKLGTKGAVSKKDEFLVQELWDLYMEEQEKNSKLMSDYLKLQDDYATHLKLSTRKKQE